MRFAHPQILWLALATLALLTCFLGWAWRKKGRLIAQFVQSRLLASLTVGVSQRIQKIRLVLLVLAVSGVMLALARPQWGFVWEETKQRGLDIIVAIDTSRSMLAEDMTPNRLTRAKLAALDLMKLAKTDRLGLVAFAGSAFLQCPLTVDDEAFRQSVDALEIGIIPQGGTALKEAVETALSAFQKEEDNHKVLVLFTDGEDHESGALETLETAVQAGVRIFTVGVGTAQGELLRQRDEAGNWIYIKDDQNNPVKSRLNERLLQQIATAGRGFYLPLRGARAMETLYERGLAPLPKSEISSKLVRHYHERFQWPLLLGILLLIAELFLPDRKKIRRPAAPTTAPELEKMAGIFLVFLLPLNAPASPANALRAYENGRFDQAQQEFQQLLKKSDDPRLVYNAGAAAYQLKQFDQAATNFSAALTSPDLTLQERAYYNLGNSFFRLGEQARDPNQKVQQWQQSLQNYETALKLDRKDADAQFNAELVKKLLEKLKQQQPQQRQSQSSPPEKDQSEDKSEQSARDDRKSSEQKEPDRKSEAPQQSQQPEPQNQPDTQAQQQPNQQKDQNAGSSKPDQSNGESPASAQTVLPTGQMTPQQAERLLDAQKGEEKNLPLVSLQKASRQSRTFKDW